MSIAYRLENGKAAIASQAELFSEASAIVDEQGTILSVNRSLSRLLQLDKEQLHRQPLTSIIIFPSSLLSQQDDRFRCKGQLLRKRKKTIRVEVEMQVYPFQGRDYYRFSFYPEYSQRLFIKQIFSTLPVGLLMTNPQQMILDINALACSLLNVERDSLLYAPVQQAFQCIPEKIYKRWFKKKYQQSHFQLKGSLHTDTRDLSVTSHPLYDEESCFAGMLYLIEDITQLQSLKKQVLANNRLATIGEIAAGSAHEIRNPLTSIKGFLQMLSTQPPEGRAYGQDYIQLMLKEIDRINSLVGEFLLLSKPRQIHRQSVQPLQLLEEIRPMIENEARLHNIELVIDRAEKSYPAVFVDSKLMKQVLLNLCKNAIEAMGEQGTLTLQIIPLIQQRQLQIRICDTGPGIPTAFFEQIFEPFFSTKEKGTGLGLPICKEIMKELGGEICLDSSSEEGTIFSVYIPIASSR